jgi:hypothetical protein
MADKEQALQEVFSNLLQFAGVEAPYLVKSPEPRVYCISLDILVFKL